MAGALAQKRHNRRSDWGYSGSGAARGEVLLLKGSDDQQVYEGEKVRAAYEHYREARAEDLVKRHWPQIERLAITLLDRETISGEDEIKKAISGTAGSRLGAGAARARSRQAQ